MGLTERIATGEPLIPQAMGAVRRYHEILDSKLSNIDMRPGISFGVRNKLMHRCQANIKSLK